MNKRGDFDVSLDSALTIARLFVIIIFAIGMTILLSFGIKTNIETSNVKAVELSNSIINCVVEGNSIEKSKIINLDDCVSTRKNAVELLFKNERFYLNERNFVTFKSLCGTEEFYCNNFEFIDENKEILKMKVLIKDE